MYNNYGYNPYNRYVPPMDIQNNVNNYQQLQTNANRQITLNGKQVESIDVVKGIDIPLDGTISYFPIADGQTIVTKQLQMDGTSKTLIYKLTDSDSVKGQTYITKDDLIKELSNIDLSDIDDLKEEIKEIKKTLKELKKKGE